MHPTRHHKCIPTSGCNEERHGTTDFTKILEEEGPWETRKEILGWVLDGIARTIQLPSTKCDKLIDILRQTAQKSHISVKELQSIQGKL